MYTFHAAKAKSMKYFRQSTCFQLIVTNKVHTHVCPMEKEPNDLLALKLFAKHIGAPEDLVTDGVKAETSAEVKRFCTSIGNDMNILEQGMLWSNLAELYIIMLKSSVSKDITESNVPVRLWEYCTE